MKAIVVHEYGGPEVLKFEEFPDPVPGPGEVLVRVAATSVNPIDYEWRAGLTKDSIPSLSRPDWSRPWWNHCEGWAWSRRFLRRRQGVRHGRQHLRRALCRESRDAGESSHGGQRVMDG